MVDSQSTSSQLYVLQVEIKFGLKCFNLGWFSITLVS